MMGGNGSQRLTLWLLGAMFTVLLFMGGMIFTTISSRLERLEQSLAAAGIQQTEVLQRLSVVETELRVLNAALARRDLSLP